MHMNMRVARRYRCNGYFSNEFRAQRGNNANEATRLLKLDIKEFKKIICSSV